MLVAALARAIAAKPEGVAAGTLLFALLLSGLSVISLTDSEVETDLSAFEIQGRPVGQRNLAAARFDDWAWNSTSAVTCFDKPPVGGAFYDGTATCADHVKATPTECAENRWQNHVCCGSCVAEGKATTKAGNPVVPLVAGAWAYSGPASSEIPAGPIGRRRVQDSDSHAKQRTLMVVLRATDGASALSAAHMKHAQNTRDAILAMASFQAVCNNDYQLDDGTGYGGDFSNCDGCDPPGNLADGCSGAGGVLFRYDTEGQELEKTVEYYGEQLWRGHYELITEGYVDQYQLRPIYTPQNPPISHRFWANQAPTTGATTLYFQLKSTKDLHDTFMSAVREFAATQPWAGQGAMISFYEHDNENEQLETTMVSDMMYAGGAVGFVFLLMLIQTRSLIITVCGFTHILLSLPVGQFLYGNVLGIDWISFLQALPLFIIMGIGADDVFVFLDAWRRSVVDHPEYRTEDNQEARLIYVMEHCVKAMSITSVTTAAAFSAICLSPVAPLRTLGIFAGAVVMSNFVLCVTWFPAVVVTCHKHGLYKDAPPKPGGQGLAETLAGGAMVDYTTTGRPIERFFAVYAMHLSNETTRRTVLVIATVVTGIAIILAGQLAMPTAMPELFPPGSNSFEFGAAQEELFSFEKYPVPSSFVWGIKAAETSLTGKRGLGIAPDDEDCIMPVYDTSVDLDSEASQAAMLTTCRLLIGAKSLVRGDVNCPILSFSQWRQNHKPPLTFPVPQAEFAEAYGQWLRSGDENTHRESVLFDETTGALLAMQGSYSSVLDTNNKNVDVMDVMDNTIQWFADNDPTHTSVFHSNDLEYRGATLQNISISGMISLVAQLCMSFFVLLFATSNWIVALLSMCSILITTIWSMSAMYALGWSFGILEAICVTVLVGLVVDYVVHMGMSYLESPSHSRKDRTIFACVNMGISICSGAISTVGASVFLTFCTITFFPKFGIFMAITIVFSFICAGVVFPAALMELGPEGSRGMMCGIFGGADDERKPLVSIEMEGSGGDGEKSSGELDDKDIDTPTPKAGGFLEQVSTPQLIGGLVGIITICTAISYGICPPGQTFCAALPPQQKELDMEFTFPSFPVTSQQTTYECRGFDFPQDETYHVTSFDRIDDSEGIVHHMILYKSPIPANKCFRECLNMPSDSQLVWAWAVGMDAFPMPPDVGFPVGKFTSTSYTSLQIHYNNVFHAPAVDNSGVTMKLTTKLRKYAMGILSLGRSPQVSDPNYPNLRIPPRRRYEAVITCKPSIILPIKIFAYAVHAHLIGKQIWAEQIRNGTIIRELGRSNVYDFSKQRFQTFDDEEHYEVIEGDTLRVHCIFDSSCPGNATSHGKCGDERTGDTTGGWATDNEMCFNFLAYYPAENLQDPLCVQDEIQELSGSYAQPGCENTRNRHRHRK